MTTIINGKTYYRTAEVCRLVGISRNTLFNLAEKSVFRDTERRDFHGWRLFTGEEIDALKACVNRVDIIKRDVTSGTVPPPSSDNQRVPTPDW
jgi:hypothetical protein